MNSPDAGVVSYNRDARIVIDDLLAAGRQYDLIFGDAFNDLSIPYHLTTREFFQTVCRHLNPDGVAALNVIGGMTQPLGDALAGTMKAVFPQVFLIDNRQQYDRNVACGSVGLQLVQNLPAIFVRHQDIEDNRQGLELPGLLQSFRAVHGADHLIPGLGEILLQEVNDVRIVIDRQYHRGVL